MTTKPTEHDVTRFADMFSAMGAGPRLRIMRLLLSAHPDGLNVGEIGTELGIPALNAFPPSGKAQERGTGERAAERDLPLVFGEQRRFAGASWLLIRRMLHAE